MTLQYAQEKLNVIKALPIESTMMTGASVRVYNPGNKLSSTNITQFLDECAKVADENNLPDGNRWIVVPPWMSHALRALATYRGWTSLVRENAIHLRLRGGARKAYVRSRRNQYFMNR